MQNLLVVIYAHHESFPPTLNAIFNLSSKFKNIYILHKNHLVSSNILPKNCILICNEKYTTVKDNLKINKFKKAYNFLIFCLQLVKSIKKNNITHCIAYDSIALFSLLISDSFNKKIVFWYHNHDILLKKNCNKFSIGWFASEFEKKAIKKINLFSLPAQERLQYFSIDKKVQYFFIPNYPSLLLYNNFKKETRNDSVIRLIYQGSIGPNHGIEDIILVLNKCINSKKIQLYLKGSIDEWYKIHLIDKAQKEGVTENLFFFDYTAYDKVPEIASTCHIGIAIHKGTDIMNKTLGTSSNKIYEYAAIGLPVILYDNEHFKKHLQQYKWANFSNCTIKSLLGLIKIIDDNYQIQSEAALKDFQKSLNFEKAFLEASNSFLNIKKNDKT
jgi:hypothetical protein